jgi:hypothetical protein
MRGDEAKLRVVSARAEGLWRSRSSVKEIRRWRGTTARRLRWRWAALVVPVSTGRSAGCSLEG